MRSLNGLLALVAREIFFGLSSKPFSTQQYLVGEGRVSLCVSIDKTQASFAIMPCVDILARQRMRFVKVVLALMAVLPPPAVTDL